MAGKFIRIRRTDWKQVKDMLREWQGSHGRTPQTSSKGPLEDADKRLWFPAKNEFSTQAPAYGVAKIHDDGAALDDRGRPYIKITQPDADSLAGCVLIRHRAIDPGKFGQVTFDPWWALYNNAATPAYDEEWGTEENTWNLKTGNTGFKILGAVDSEGERVLVQRAEASGGVRILKFELNEALSVSDATADADVLFMVHGSSPGATVTVTNMESSTPGTYAFSGTTGAVGYAIERSSNNSWLILQMICG